MPDGTVVVNTVVAIGGFLVLLIGQVVSVMMAFARLDKRLSVIEAMGTMSAGNSVGKAEYETFRAGLEGRLRVIEETVKRDSDELQKQRDRQHDFANTLTRMKV